MFIVVVFCCFQWLLPGMPALLRTYFSSGLRRGGCPKHFKLGEYSFRWLGCPCQGLPANTELRRGIWRRQRRKTRVSGWWRRSSLLTSIIYEPFMFLSMFVCFIFFSTLAAQNSCGGLAFSQDHSVVGIRWAEFCVLISIYKKKTGSNTNGKREGCYQTNQNQLIWSHCDTNQTAQVSNNKFTP